MTDWPPQSLDRDPHRANLGSSLKINGADLWSFQGKEVQEEWEHSSGEDIGKYTDTVVEKSAAVTAAKGGRTKSSS